MNEPVDPVFLHCNACRLPSTPSGRRLLPIPEIGWPGARGAEGVRVACEGMAAVRRHYASLPMRAQEG
jgi:hypothetical protein